MKYKNNKIELLAPAGDLEKLKYAFAYGADAVYLGLPAFSLRAKTGFDLKSIKAGVDYAHQLKKKVYVTINVFAHNRHIRLLPEHLKKLKRINPDAVILSDPGVLNLVKKYLPKTDIHLSTQMNTLNYEAVKFWQQQGVKQIILGREATLKDIREIHQQVPKMELEVFVHGAMCMSYSGRCYLSAWLNGRSANEGLCTQPCRWEYKVYLEEGLRQGEMMPIEADEQGTYIMNSKDLCLIEYLDELKKAGVISFKLEGRTKSRYYLAMVVKAYREALDKKLKKPEIKKLKRELLKIDNRGYTTGFLLGNEEYTRQEFKTSKAVSAWEFVGEVVNSRNLENNKSKKQIYFKAHNALKAGDVVELVTPENCYKIKMKKIFDSKGNLAQEVHGGTEEIFSFELSEKYEVVERSVLRKLKKVISNG